MTDKDSEQGFSKIRVTCSSGDTVWKVEGYSTGSFFNAKEDLIVQKYPSVEKTGWIEVIKSETWCSYRIQE